MAGLAALAPALIPLAMKFLKNGGFKSKGYKRANANRITRKTMTQTKRSQVNTKKKPQTSKKRQNSQPKLSQLTSLGGGAASGMPAPVAFARNGEIRPFAKTLKSDIANGTKIHSVDFVGPLTASATGAVVIGSVTINPSNTSTFPWLANTVAAGYEKYKLKMLRMHYVHFCPTSVQGTIMMMYNSDVLAATPTTESQMQNDSNAIEGALYEDIFLDIDLTGLSEDWMFVGAGSTDTRNNAAGQIFIGTANCPTSNTYGNVGNYYVEAIWQFVERKLPAQTEPVQILRNICASSQPTSIKRKWLHELVDSMSLESGPPEKKKRTEEDIIHDRIKKLSVTPG